MIKVFRFDKIKLCSIKERVNRFTVKIKIDEKEDYALLTNTGRLKDIIFEGNKAMCIERNNIKKLKYTLIGTYVNEEYYTLIDTRFQMQIFEILQDKGMIEWLKKAKLVKRNVKVFNSLIDYLFKENDKDIFLEIKSAVLFDGYYSMYPDCPSLRGRKHVEDIIKLSKMGIRSIICFIAAHPNAKAFKPSKEGDEVLSRLIEEANKKYNVEIHAVKFFLDKSGTVIFETDDLPVHF
jgi:sugar fermentation stimulation protein